MGALRVYAIDKNMNRCTGDIPYKSLDWHRCYYECGDFTLEVPLSIYDPAWAYICTDERPETGIIQRVEYSDTAQVSGGDDTIVLSGFFLESLLNRVTFLVEEPEDKTIEIEPPSSPYYIGSRDPQVYVTESGEYAYKNSSGDIVTASGEQLSGTDGLTEVGVKFPTEMGGQAYVSSIYGYFTEDEGSTIHEVVFDGAERTFDVAFTDDKGNYYYQRDGSDDLIIAWGVASYEDGNYWSRYRKWMHGPQEVTIKVKGPWQRTETEEPVTEGDPVQIVLGWVREFCGNAFQIVETDVTGEKKAVDPSLQRLGDLMYSVLKDLQASFRVVYNFKANTMSLEVYRGDDITQDQSKRPWAVFSDTWGTLKGFKASRDTSNYCNTCYVLYEYDEPTAWADDGSPALIPDFDDHGQTTGWHVDYTTRRGYVKASVAGDDEAAMETYLDLRGDGPQGDDSWSRDEYKYDEDEEDNGKPKLKSVKSYYDSYQQSLMDSGLENLRNNYGVITQLDTGEIDMSRYVTEYDLGDLVDMSVNAMGVKETARIVEVDEVYSTSGSSVKTDISMTIGDVLVSSSQKYKLV